jgi:phosphoglycerate kinase
MEIMTVQDINVSGKKVLTRVDFNVPLNEKTGLITDDSRIKAAVPTIEYLIEHNARVILCSHLGRPKGRPEAVYSLNNVARRLAEILRQPVAFSPDCIGSETEDLVNNLNNGDVLLLENLRFHAEEETNDPEFARALASLAEIYVDDAFGTAHREHASIVGVARFLPAVAGLLLQKELRALGKVLQNPVHPFGLLLGGAKVSDKVALIENIMPKVDHIVIGGGMAAIFLKARGYEVGRSLLESTTDTASKIMQRAERSGIKIHLPEDVVITDRDSDTGPVETVLIDAIPHDKRIVDMGALTISRFRRVLEKCKTVFWNGPMGIYENPRFAEGTFSLAYIIASLNAATILGGGSTAEVVTELRLNEKMSFVSTGGGASLEFLSGQTLPGVAVLQKMPPLESR